jgi:hypothetical protein
MCEPLWAEKRSKRGSQHTYAKKISPNDSRDSEGSGSTVDEMKAAAGGTWVDRKAFGVYLMTAWPMRSPSNNEICYGIDLRDEL